MSRNFKQDLTLIQSRMKTLDVYEGKVDGLWGDKSFQGIMELIEREEHSRSPSTPPPARPSVNYEVALEIASHEAIIRQAYKDSANPPVWTWSVGLTSATGHSVLRYVDNPQPLQHCLNIYIWALKNYAVHVDSVFEGHLLTPEQYTGALSFHWNTGAIRRASWVKAFKAGDMKEAEALFKQWHSSGQLVERRRKEADLIWRGVWSNEGQMAEYTRLTSRHTPVWSSAIRRDVRTEMLVAFGENTEPILDNTPKPFNVPSAPTLSAGAQLS